MAEETNQETIAGRSPEEEQEAAAQDMQQENPGETAADGEACRTADDVKPDESADGGVIKEEPAADPADNDAGGPDVRAEEADEDEVVDGTFTKAPEGRKPSFFKKKKDKRDEKIEELTDRVKRQMAEFDNFRKRTDKEKSQMFDLGAKSVIEKILPVIDNFERGLAQAQDKEDPFVDGMDKIYKSMLQELESIGVKPIEAEGKEFDPNLHNAVMHCEDDSVGENIVVQELQKGYTYHDSVVRHSMVKVAN